MNKFKLTIKTLLTTQDQKESPVSVISKEKEYVDRILHAPLSADHYSFLKSNIRYVGVTSNFREVVDYFKTPAGEILICFTFSESLPL